MPDEIGAKVTASSSRNSPTGERAIKSPRGKNEKVKLGRKGKGQRERTAVKRGETLRMQEYKKTICEEENGEENEALKSFREGKSRPGERSVGLRRIGANWSQHEERRR